MSRDLWTPDDLEAAVRASPDDPELRRRLITALIRKQDTANAREHVDILLTLTPGEPSAIEAAITVADLEGDALQVARLRKRLRRVVNVDVPDAPAAIHPAHPSQERDAPKLRLLEGGALGSSQSSRREQTSRRLQHIEGLATVKRTINEIIETARTTDIPSDGAWLGGTLFYGPPSCGKAFCAEVIAGELDAALWYFDLAVPWGADHLSEVIERAIAASSERTAVLYFDNLDSRAGEGSVPVAERLLTALDGARRRGRALVLGAATLPWQVSSSIVRPGRLGHVLLVLPPDAPARRVFVEAMFRGRAGIEDTDVDWIVRHTEGHSFGDLQQLADVAIAITVASGLDRGTSLPSISHDTCRRARQQVAASSAEWLTTAGHHALMNEGGGLYDDLLAYFHHRQRH